MINAFIPAISLPSKFLIALDKTFRSMGFIMRAGAQGFRFVVVFEHADNDDCISLSSGSLLISAKTDQPSRPGIKMSKSTTSGFCWRKISMPHCRFRQKQWSIRHQNYVAPIREHWCRRRSAAGVYPRHWFQARSLLRVSRLFDLRDFLPRRAEGPSFGLIPAHGIFSSDGSLHHFNKLLGDVS